MLNKIKRNIRFNKLRYSFSNNGYNGKVVYNNHVYYGYYTADGEYYLVKQHDNVSEVIFSSEIFGNAFESKRNYDNYQMTQAILHKYSGYYSLYGCGYCNVKALLTNKPYNLSFMEV